MRDQTVQVDDLKLVALPSAVNCADLFVRFTLTEWRVESIVPDVRRTAEALVKAVVGDAKPTSTPTMLLFRLRLSGTSLAVEIEDDRTSPELRVPRTLAGPNSGVQLLSTGKQLLWCEVPLPKGMDATVVPLPRRGTTRAAAAAAPPPAEIAAADDLSPDVMERILKGLRRGESDGPMRI
ncbi:ATP-binding protein [Actinophytocola sp. KF-1]